MVKITELTAFTMGKAHLNEIQWALEAAQSCLLNETPEGMSREDAKEWVLEKIRAALTNHVPSVRSRVV